MTEQMKQTEIAQSSLAAVSDVGFVVYTSEYHSLISFPYATNPFQSPMNKCHSLCFPLTELTSVSSKPITIS